MRVRRLNEVVNKVVPIYGRGNYPTLEVRLKELVCVVRDRLLKADIQVREIRLNGGAASHVLDQQPYNDLDLIFAVDLSDPLHFDRVMTATLESLMDFLPDGVRKNRMSPCSMKEAYVHKMVKVSTPDRWSLISLSNSHGRNVELKFVDRMRRQFEFSVDSFQIILDSLLLFEEHASVPMSGSFYPTVIGESMYGDFQEAVRHLHEKLIATKQPEEIRGGGLLKYCNLLVKGYKPAVPDEMKSLERYMCSRFFIDFSDLIQQECKLENYLANHFMQEEESLKYDYLMILHRVVEESTVCLMGHERRQTLSLIQDLAFGVYCQEQATLISSHFPESLSVDFPPGLLYANQWFYSSCEHHPRPHTHVHTHPQWLPCA
ncbi:unnamed protein product [Darwinula stevensoni]|uniref:polynucleotide adenylyltransferase n=1 Tax=Darwinula stevensoni TaxID=69355 RepID=A0A7R8WY40_9CRUS|nr:unnamed protein product [Darwinula stevensoni]CAG0878975.1 unnamed protein product [Darwinula stevensoni]